MKEVNNIDTAIIDILSRLEIIERTLKIHNKDEQDNSSIRKYFKI